LRIHQQAWKNFQQISVVSIVRKLSVAAILGVLFVCITLGLNSGRAQAQTVCSSGDRTYVVVSGDSLSEIAYRFGTNWEILASHNHIANPNLIYANQVICIPGGGTVNNTTRTSASALYISPNPTSHTNSVTSASSTNPPVGTVNVFPYGQCTWWADQRYLQLHGVYVPWRTQSDAWEWTARAYQFGWQVSSLPTVGSIIDLQPWVEGAYGLGHVAVVEQVLGNGQVIASTTNWGAYPWQVTYVQFTPGSGVTFISR
jgi:surface antigen